MAKPSRITSERQRRLIISGLMLVVLAGTTAAAWWLSDRENAARVPRDVQTHEVGSFELSAPAGWRVERRRSQRVIKLYDTDARRRGLVALELISRTPMTPEMALREAIARRLSLPTGTKLFRTMRRDRAHAFFAVYHGAATPVGQNVGATHLFAAITLDGYRHLIIYLAVSGHPDRADQVLLEWIATAARDKRYKPVETPQAQVGPLTMAVPTGVTVLNSTKQAASSLVLMVSDSGEALSTAGVSGLRFRPEPDEPEMTPETLRVDLAQFLAEQFSQQTGRPASESPVTERRVGRYAAYSVPLSSRSAPVRRALWVVGLNAEIGLLVNVAAAPDRFDSTEAWVAEAIGNIRLPDEMEPTDWSRPGTDAPSDQPDLDVPEVEMPALENES